MKCYLIIVVQMMKQGKDVEASPQGAESQTSRDTYIIFRVIYASILVIFLLIICFYFDLLQDYDALSLVLGFVVCLTLQFFFLSYYFRHEMKKYKIDEIGVLKWKIKLIFGELNQKHIERKNRIKYYRHEGNQKDRLFHKDNQQIYQNVMSILRGKEEANFNDMIPKTKSKWHFLEEKMVLLEKFMAEMLRKYDNRRQIYNRYKASLLRIKDKREYKEWQDFLKEEEKHDKRGDIMDHTSYYSLNSTPAALTSSRLRNPTHKLRLNWQIFNWFILQKLKLNQREVTCLKQNILKEYSIYISSIKQSKEENNKIRDKLLHDFKAAREEKNQIIKEIQRISIRYSQIKQSLQNNRIKQEQDVEAILKKEFDLRLQKIELQNYQIKISRAQSFILYTSELLYNHLEQEDMDLEDHLNKLNSKFTNYLNMMAGFGEPHSPPIRRHFQEEREHSDQQDFQIVKDYEFLLQKSADRRKGEITFKSYLVDATNLFKELSNNHNETDGLIQEYKPKFERAASDGSKNQGRMKKQLSGARLHYYASNVKDLKILKMFQKLNAFQCRFTESIANSLLRQSNSLLISEDHAVSISKRIKLGQEEVRRKEEELKKMKRRASKDENQQVGEEVGLELQDLKDRLSGEINQYLHAKVPTTLVEIIQSMIENETSYEKYASELFEEQNFEQAMRLFRRSNEMADNQDTRARQRHTAYSNCVDKLKTSEFDEDLLDNDDHFAFEKQREYRDIKAKNQVDFWSFADTSLRDNLSKTKSKETLRMIPMNTFKQSVARSNEILNRVLGVLVNEWSKSQFFHQFVKEELLVSLNRKKPDIVQHLNIEYFKIVERVKTVGPLRSIRVHQSQIYRCLFDFVLDFQGKIAVQIGTRLKISKKPALQIKLLIKEFQCPIRVCFTPYSLGKSYASLLERPKLSIDYSVTLGGFNLTKIPFFTQIIKTYIVLKLRKKMLWPKRMTLSVPLAFKSTLDLAILQRNKFQRDKEKLERKVQ